MLCGALHRRVDAVKVLGRTDCSTDSVVKALDGAHCSTDSSVEALDETDCLIEE